MAVTAEPEVQQFDVREPRGHDRPRSGRARCLHAMADRTAVMHPSSSAALSRRIDRRAVVHPQATHLENGVGRQPQFALLEPRRQVVESHGAGFSAHARRPTAIGEIDLQPIAAFGGNASDIVAVDHQIEYRGRRRLRNFDARRQHVEFDVARGGRELEPHPRRHRHHDFHEQRHLRTRPVRQAPRHDAGGPPIDIECADDAHRPVL